MAMPPAVPAAGDAAAAVGPDVLAAALAASAHGVALLDEQGRCVHVNPAGCALLGAPLADLLGQVAPFAGPDDAVGPTRPRRLLRWTAPGSLRERELEHQEQVVRTADGRRLTVVTFRDVTDVRVQRRRFTAFATAAANVAYAGSLRGTLDTICAELVETAGLAGAQIFLVDASGTRMRVHGAAPVDRWPLGLRAAPRGGPAPRGGAQLVRGAADRPTGGDPAQEGADARRPSMGAAARPARQLRVGRLRRRARWWSATARSARSTPTAGPATSPTTTRSRS